jgi:glycolate oxidase
MQAKTTNLLVIPKYMVTAADEQSLIRMWGARKNALNRATKLTVGSRRPIGLIEDTVVHPDMLYDHAQQLTNVF